MGCVGGEFELAPPCPFDRSGGLPSDNERARKHQNEQDRSDDRLCDRERCERLRLVAETHGADEPAGRSSHTGHQNVGAGDARLRRCGCVELACGQRRCTGSRCNDRARVAHIPDEHGVIDIRLREVLSARFVRKLRELGGEASGGRRAQ